MGHSWREMFPEEAEESDRRSWVNKACRALQKELSAQPASLFTVGEIALIITDVDWRADNSQVLVQLEAMKARATKE